MEIQSQQRQEYAQLNEQPQMMSLSLRTQLYQIRNCLSQNKNTYSLYRQFLRLFYSLPTPQQQQILSILSTTTSYLQKFYLSLGDIFAKHNKKTKAIECYQKTIQHQPNHPKIYFKLAKLYSSVKNTQGAIDCYRRIIQIDPTILKAYHKLAAELDNSNQISQAIDYYKQVLCIDPKNTDVHSKLIQALIKTNRINEATYYKNLVQMGQKRAQPWYQFYIGQCFRNLNKVANRKFCQTEGKAEPKQVASLLSLAYMYRSMQRYNQSLACFQKYQEMMPGRQKVQEEIQWLKNVK